MKKNYFNKFYFSSRLFGNDKIIRSYFKVKKKEPIPLSIPHGIDFFQHEKFIHDFYNYEPFYVCFRDDLTLKVKSKHRKTINLPHPWLMLLDKKKNKLSDHKGTLIITGSPSFEKYEELYKKIEKDKFLNPLYVLIKDRDATAEHFKWWEKRGIYPFSAGPIESSKFYIKLFNILQKCSDVIIFDMTSAAIFAAAMRKKIHVIKNIYTSNIELDIVSVPDKDSFNYKKVRQIWTNLLSKDKNISYETANYLLGRKFLSDKKKIELLNILKSDYKPLFLYPLKSKLIYRLVLYLICINSNIIKFFPSPFEKIITKFKTLLSINKIYFTRINTFGYYKIVGDFEKPKKFTFYQYQLEEYKPGRHVKIKQKYKHLYNF